MNCWACQTKMICGDSRPLYEGRQRYRRYDCPKCGERTYTLEKIISVYEVHKLPLREHWNEAYRRAKRNKELRNGTEEKEASGPA